MYVLLFKGACHNLCVTYTLLSTANPYGACTHFNRKCYFLLSAKASQPIIYSVDRVRQGKTYATRAVKAIQSGKVVFILLCSFQIPEPTPRRHQWPFPAHVPDPEACETALQRYQRLSKLPGMSAKVLETLKVHLNVSLSFLSGFNTLN